MKRVFRNSVSKENNSGFDKTTDKTLRLVADDNIYDPHRFYFVGAAAVDDQTILVNWQLRCAYKLAETFDDKEGVTYYCVLVYKYLLALTSYI